jgi:hypothetical protein
MNINIPLLQVHTRPGSGWLRVFGFGITWKDTRRHRLIFSERNGYCKHILIGHWSFSFLKP